MCLSISRILQSNYSKSIKQKALIFNKLIQRMVIKGELDLRPVSVQVIRILKKIRFTKRQVEQCKREMIMLKQQKETKNEFFFKYFNTKLNKAMAERHSSQNLFYK